MQKFVIFVEKSFKINNKKKRQKNSEVIVIIQMTREVFAPSKCYLKHSVPKEILIIFHNGCNYDYQFITK